MSARHPHPCADCVEVYGDDPAAWLARWPQGAEWRPRWGLHLCDGCTEEREDWARAVETDAEAPPAGYGWD